MKRLLLAGVGHAHAVLLHAFAKNPLYGVRITVVTPFERQIYSGMLPGVVAGHYARREAEIDVARLVERACAEFVQGEVAALDAAGRRVKLRDGSELAYDIASLNVGSQADSSIPGSAEHALAAKPFERFIEHLRLGARTALVGAGAAGVELAMAIRHRGGEATLYSEHPAFRGALERRVLRALRHRRVNLIGLHVSALHPGPVVLAGKSQAAYDQVILATGAAPLPWLRDCALAKDANGFVLVDESLRSLSNPEVFAAGDCATLRETAHPRSGLYAVRHGQALAANLRNLMANQPLERYRPQERALMLLSCGGRYAIAQRGGWTAEGHLAWRWKDRIDRRWIGELNAWC